jgi:predicted ferric reductase
MSEIKAISRQPGSKKLLFWMFGVALFISAAILGTFVFLFFKNQIISSAVAGVISRLFALNNAQTTWYITRAAGWVAYFLLWFSMVWGLAIPSKFFEHVLSPTFAVDFHEYISLLSIGFIALHVGALLVDQYLPFTISQVLVPFLAPYRPVWVGFGVLGFYLTALVTVTFYLRKRIGQKRFKAIHLLSLLAYLGVVFHAFFAGTDSSLGAVQLIYLGTFLVVVFLTAYWLIRGRQIKNHKVGQLSSSYPARALKR